MTLNIGAMIIHKGISEGSHDVIKNTNMMCDRINIIEVIEYSSHT